MKPKIKENIKAGLSNVFNTLSGKKGYAAAAFCGAAILGAGAAVVTAAVAASPIVPVALAADAVIWAWGSHFHAQRNARKGASGTGGTLRNAKNKFKKIISRIHL